MKRFGYFVLMAALAVPMAMSASIILVTDQPGIEAPGTGNLADYLRSLGYQVTVDEGTPGASAYRGTLTATKIAHLESFDLVFFHRSTGSGSFVDPNWSTMNVPLINGSAFTARNNPARWDWVQGNDIVETSQYVVADVPTHPIFMGVTLTDNMFQWYSVDQDFSALNIGGNPGNGTLLAETEQNLYAAIIVWDNPGAFFPGGAATHTERRIFLNMLRYFEDDGSGAIAFKNYTPAALKVIANTVEYAITGKVTGQPVSVANWDLY